MADSWIDELAEATMGQSLDVHGPDAEPAARRRTWAWAGAAAAVVLGATAVGILTGGPDTPYVGAGPTQTVMTLALPPADVAASCIQFSVEVLRPMEVAFSGTALNACGFSSEWTPEMAETFAEGFGG